MNSKTKDESLLEVLSQRHEDWKCMARSLGADEHDVDDVVQDMYIRMYIAVDNIEKIRYKDDINTLYVYRTIMSVIYDKHRSDKETPTDFNEFVDLDDLDDMDVSGYNHSLNTSSNYLNRMQSMLVTDDASSDQERRQRAERMVKVVRNEMKNWHWFDEMLCKIYFETDVSMRAIASKSDISLNTIFNTIKNGK